jgi:hypothetical protein
VNSPLSMLNRVVSRVPQKLFSIFSPLFTEVVVLTLIWSALFCDTNSI